MPHHLIKKMHFVIGSYAEHNFFIDWDDGTRQHMTLTEFFKFMAEQIGYRDAEIEYLEKEVARLKRKTGEWY